MKLSERFIIWVGDMLPGWLVLAAVARAMRHATSGAYARSDPQTVSAFDVLQRWADYCALTPPEWLVGRINALLAQCGARARIYYHHQNLNEREGRPLGNMLWHGRAWLSLWDAWADRRAWPVLGWSWAFGRWSSFLAATIAFNDSDRDICVHVGVPWLFSFWVHVERLPGWSWPLHAQSRIPESREIGFSFFDGCLCILLWSNPWERNHDDPWWWDIRVNLVDALLGRAVHSRRELYTERVVVELAEGEYGASVCSFESTWQRPRWPWPKRMVRATITPDTPIPIPGKGENSWDCEDTATASMTCQAATPQAAAAALKESVEHTRLKYGGSSWRPG